MRKVTENGLQDEQVIVNGTERYSYIFEHQEIPQCNNTKVCSTLNIENLEMEMHDGFYSFRCHAGYMSKENERHRLIEESRLFRIMGEQSAPPGLEPITYSLNCESGQIQGEIAIYGQPVIATFHCKGRDDLYYEVPATSTREQSYGYTLFTFFPPQIEEGLTCKYTGYNKYARWPLSVEASVLKMVESLQLRIAEPYLEGKHSFCCDICGIGITTHDITIRCFLDADDPNSNQIPTSVTGFKDEREKAKFSKCGTLMTHILQSVFCKCSVELLPETESLLIFYANGEISQGAHVTKTPVTYEEQLLNFTTPLWNTPPAGEQTFV